MSDQPREPRRRDLRDDDKPPVTPRHAASRARHTGLRRVGAAALGAVVFLGTAFGLAYGDLQGNIDQRDVGDLIGRDRPAGSGEDDDATEPPLDQKAGQSVNLLVFGSDTRDGQTAATDEVEGMRSDTTMIVHISADRERVEAVSIPRDTLVEIPECTLPDGTVVPAQSEAMFNSAFQTGGETGDPGAAAACAIRTVEQLTGVFIDDFVVVDFAGFINVVDALDGVPMYIPEAIDDDDAHLVLEAGCQVLDGEKALGFARARKTLGDGSDISRISRQQELVAAIAREALSKNLLTDLASLYRFLDASTSTLTTGRYVGSLPTMAGLANSLRGMSPSDIRFETMPFEWAGVRVRPAPEAAELWERLRTDVPIDAELTGTGETPTEEPTATADPTGTPTETPTTPATPQPTPTPTPTIPVCTK